jgi:hypothetical protein
MSRVRGGGIVMAACGQPVTQKANTMKFGALASAAVVMTALLLALPGCQREEGPAEKAGKEIDKAAEQAGETIDKAGAKIGEEVEKAGEKMQDAAKRDKK